MYEMGKKAAELLLLSIQQKIESDTQPSADIGLRMNTPLVVGDTTGLAQASTNPQTLGASR